MSSSKTNKKPYCKVCHDAGKPESEYTSHYVRSMPDRNGVTTVTCPTLLCTECNYCYKLGHTTKFCPVIAANKNSHQNKKYEKRETPKKNIAEIAFPKRAANFAVLAESDSEDEDFPTLCAESENVQVTTGWASIAAKPEVFVVKEVDPTENYQVFTRRIGKIQPINSDAKKVKRRWADESDSDDE